MKAKRAALVSRRRLRVVIAENHVLLRDLIAKLLSESSNCFRLVASVATFMAAMDVCADLKPDLLLISVALLGGETSLQISRIRVRAPQIGILAYGTPHVRNAFAIQAIKGGVTSYVGNTRGLSAFLEAIDRTARGEPYFCPESSRFLTEIACGKPASGEGEALSCREREILLLIANGKTNKNIAHSLSLSVGTVDTHRRNLMAKAGAHNTADLIRYGLKNNLIAS